MSTIVDKKDIGKLGYEFHIERYENAIEVVDKCRTRNRTSTSFHDMPNESVSKDWEGVDSYDEALEYLRNGYQPTVEAMRGVFKAGTMGECKRFTFQNSVVGFAPVVPLVLRGVPNSMINMEMRPIKAKVVDIYYDMTASCSISPKDIIEAGQKLLGTVIELEKQGYRFNLYACQTYSGEWDCDMLVVKVKSSTQPLDLKRISFPLTHTAFFRVIGFDWYSKVPGGKYRSGYGRTLAHRFEGDGQLQEIGKQLFGKNAILFSATEIIKKDKEHIREVVLNNGDSKA